MEWRGEGGGLPHVPGVFPHSLVLVFPPSRVPSSPRSFGTAPEPPQLAGPPPLCVFFAGLECPFFVLLRLTHVAAATVKFKMAPQLLRPVPASRAPGRPAKSVVRSTSGHGSIAPPGHEQAWKREAAAPGQSASRAVVAAPPSQHLTRRRLASHNRASPAHRGALAARIGRPSLPPVGRRYQAVGGRLPGCFEVAAEPGARGFPNRRGSAVEGRGRRRGPGETEERDERQEPQVGSVHRRAIQASADRGGPVRPQRPQHAPAVYAMCVNRSKPMEARGAS
ncbi:hypothetical protein NDU88_004835 [Pleurodeles waltl]|uniref:Uncharacterized protein n=1 Tax=Pleurodeles waltl TaxID=8319 RepID=A0AAV7LL32_PLEWA|nr:hypothetical protein NDU88_004835 [Pleurodeles waltl]